MAQGLEAFLVHVAVRSMMGRFRIVLHHRLELFPYTDIHIQGERERERQRERDAFSYGFTAARCAYLSLYIYIYILWP